MDVWNWNLFTYEISICEISIYEIFTYENFTLENFIYEIEMWRANSSIVLEVHGVKCYDHLEIAPAVWPLQSFGLNFLWQCVIFQHLVFIK